MRLFTLFALSLFCCPRVFAESSAIEVAVELFPIGSFTMTAPTIEGKGRKTGATYQASELKVAVSSLDTGIKLRTEHLQSHLEAKTYPSIIAKNITAKNGTGKADLTIRNITRPIQFTYKDLGAGRAQATFKLSLSDYQITGINFKGVGVQDEVQVTATVAYEEK